MMGFSHVISFLPRLVLLTGPLPRQGGLAVHACVSDIRTSIWGKSLLTPITELQKARTASLKIVADIVSCYSFTALVKLRIR